MSERKRGQRKGQFLHMALFLLRKNAILTLFSALFVICFTAPYSIAYAACSGPSGQAGDMIYNKDHKVMQFCNGTVWQAMSSYNKDGVPDAFDFTDVTGAALSTQVTSNTVTMSGMGVAVAVSISGGGSPEFRINGGSWVTSGTVSDGDTLQLRLTSPASGGATLTATVDVGGVSDEWGVSTSADTTPDAFNFTDQTGVATSTQISSNTITIAGISGTASVSVSGDGSPQVNINGGGWVSSGTITNGQTLQVRLTSSGSFSTAQTATVTVGGVSDNWSVTTAGADTTPDGFNFSDRTEEATSTQITSNSVTISGINSAASVSVSGDGSPQININGGGWVSSGTISNGQSLQVRLTSAGSAGTIYTATVNVGGVTDDWSVTTQGCPLPWGGGIANGASVTAYQSYSSTTLCQSETRTCSFGTLSGSYTAGSCTGQHVEIDMVCGQYGEPCTPGSLDHMVIVKATTTHNITATDDDSSWTNLNSICQQYGYAAPTTTKDLNTSSNWLNTSNPGYPVTSNEWNPTRPWMQSPLMGSFPGGRIWIASGYGMLSRAIYPSMGAGQNLASQCSSIVWESYHPSMSGNCPETSWSQIWSGIVQPGEYIMCGKP